MFLQDISDGDQIFHFCPYMLLGDFCVLFTFVEVIHGGPFLRSDRWLRVYKIT
jgi:hypothetical protein